VSIAAAPLRQQLLERQKYIVYDRRVGIFVYGNGRRRMGAINYYMAAANTRLTNNRLDLAGNIYHLVTALSADAEVFLEDFHIFYSHLHLFYYFDTQKQLQAVLDGLCSQITKQLPRWPFILPGLQDRAVRIKDAELLLQLIKIIR
jgi:hypothetical protein